MIVGPVLFVRGGAGGERYIRCKNCSAVRLSVGAKRLRCPADDQDFGERSPINVVAWRSGRLLRNHWTRNSVIPVEDRCVNRIAVILILLVTGSSLASAQSAGGSSSGGSAAATGSTGYAGSTLSTGHTISGTGGSSGPNVGSALSHAATGDADASSVSPAPTSHDNAVDTPAAERAIKNLGNTDIGILKK